MFKFVGLVVLITVYIEYTAADVRVEAKIGIAKPAACNCIQTVLAEMPSDSATCSCSDFISGLNKNLEDNYKLIDQELSKEDCKNCNFKDVEESLRKIRLQIKKIIQILSDCDANVKLLNDAIAKYDDIKKSYNAAIRNATASQSNACGNILAKIRPVALNSAENIMAAVLKCLNFKSC